LVGTSTTHVPPDPGDDIAATIAKVAQGATDYAVSPIPIAAPDIRRGELAALGVTASRRSPLLPDVNFASNTLVTATAPGNPKKIASFTDLNQPGVSVVVCAVPVPCGSATKRIEDATGVQLHPVSEDPSVTDVLEKVTSGQADAGLVYVTDALTAGDKVTTVKFPQAANAVNTYPIVALKGSKHADLAKKFVDLVTGDTGQKILSQAGFAKP
jgi:molybdate transport system substrate-binding protein